MSRIYAVQIKGSEPPEGTYLIRAETGAQALRRVAGEVYTVKPVSAVEAIELIELGVKVENAVGAERGEHGTG